MCTYARMVRVLRSSNNNCSQLEGIRRKNARDWHSVMSVRGGFGFVKVGWRDGWRIGWRIGWMGGGMGGCVVGWMCGWVNEWVEVGLGCVEVHTRHV